MTRRPGNGTGRTILRLAVAGAVLVGTPLAIAGTANAADDSTWDKLAKCESGGNWSIDTGNGFKGGLQFTASTWKAFGGSGSPSNATREQQIAVAERVLAAQGWGAWPSCSKKVGASGKAEPGKGVKVKASAPKAAAPKPTAPAAAPAAPAAPAAAPAAPAVAGAPDYTVVAGDTLGSIASAKNVPGGWQALFSRNADVLKDPNVLAVGQQLHVG